MTLNEWKVLHCESHKLVLRTLPVNSVARLNRLNTLKSDHTTINNKYSYEYKLWQVNKTQNRKILMCSIILRMNATLVFFSDISSFVYILLRYISHNVKFVKHSIF